MEILFFFFLFNLQLILKLLFNDSTIDFNKSIKKQKKLLINYYRDKNYLPLKSEFFFFVYLSTNFITSNKEKKSNFLNALICL